MTGRRLAEVIRDVVAASTEDLTAPAVLERLGAALREVLPGAGAAVVLEGDSRPYDVVVPDGVPPTGEPVVVPLRVADEQLGTLRVYPGHAGGGDDDTVRVLVTLAEVTAACLHMARTNAELRASLERTRQDALHDPLTGLPNRVLLLDRLEQALKRSRRSERSAAVLFADLDRFKEVNDGHGHLVGDALLVAFAGRLRGLLRPGDTAARLGGDEFVVLCEDIGGPSEAEAIGARLASALSDPFSLAAGTMHVTASIGIVTATADHHSAAALLDDADAAMYQAKQRGGHRYEVIDLRSDDGVAARQALAEELAAAIDRGDIHLDYRPVVQTVDGRVAGVEAISRWSHPTRGALPTGDFVALAERSGLLADLGRAVLERACAERCTWEVPGRRTTVGVTVAAKHLLLPGFASTVAEVLDGTGTEPSALILGIGEGVVAEHLDRVIPILERVQRLGVTLALDGFGTGRSSLGSLRGVHFDIVNLDPRVAAELVDDPTSHATVFATTELAHLLGMTVVAHGIETEVQRQQVTVLGCDYSAGPLFSPPVSAGALAALLATAEA